MSGAANDYHKLSSAKRPKLAAEKQDSMLLSYLSNNNRLEEAVAGFTTPQETRKSEGVTTTASTGHNEKVVDGLDRAMRSQTDNSLLQQALQDQNDRQAGKGTPAP